LISTCFAYVLKFISWRCFIIKKNDILINEEIKDKEVRLVDSDGSMLGIVKLAEAQQLAAAKTLDLVKIAPQAEPPVCKIMDYGKYLFEISKKEKESKKSQKVTSMKEVRLSPSIEDHDFNFKVKNAIKFLKEGDRVKVSVRFKGREIAYSTAGRTVLKKFAESCTEFATIEKEPKLDGRSMIMFLQPK
jgi:translation initiation factor IF-3